MQASGDVPSTGLEPVAYRLGGGRTRQVSASGRPHVHSTCTPEMLALVLDTSRCGCDTACMQMDVFPGRFSRFSPLLDGLDQKIGFHATAPDDGRLIIQLAARPFPRCQGCGQPLSEVPPRPATWLDARTGDPIGGWDHQHGCGTWNSPDEQIIDLPAHIFDDDFDDDTAWAIVKTAIADAVQGLETSVADDVAGEAAEIELRLRLDLAAAVADPDDETLITGGDDEPGVWRNYDGQLEAWDFWPGRHVGDDVRTILITEADL